MNYADAAILQRASFSRHAIRREKKDPIAPESPDRHGVRTKIVGDRNPVVTGSFESELIIIPIRRRFNGERLELAVARREIHSLWFRHRSLPYLWPRAHHFRRERGSSTSRSPSPSKLNPITVSKIASPGKVL